VRIAVIEEDLRPVCCVAGDLDDVAVSPTGAAALKAFAAHDEIGRLLEGIYQLWQLLEYGTSDFGDVCRWKRRIF